jgi:hypothetical protein
MDTTVPGAVISIGLTVCSLIPIHARAAVPIHGIMTSCAIFTRPTGAFINFRFTKASRVAREASTTKGGYPIHTGPILTCRIFRTVINIGSTPRPTIAGRACAIIHVIVCRAIIDTRTAVQASRVVTVRHFGITQRTCKIWHAATRERIDTIDTGTII